MGRRREEGWRDRAASDLLIRQLPALAPEGRALVLGDPLPDVAAALEGRGMEVTRWNRRAFGGVEATPWPPPGPFHLAALRLPRSKAELAMALHASAARMDPEGHILVYGAKDEGVRSAMSPLDEIFPGAETLATGGHARVLRAPAWEVPGTVRGSLEEWRVVVNPDHPELGETWVSYPGVFAHPRLDPGTRLLLDALPPLPPGARVLDYGCGSGMVGAVARARSDGVRLTLLDVDALALKAAEENVPGAQLLLRDGLPAPEAVTCDAILTNPPFHRGKEADPEMVREMIRKAPALLGNGGLLIFVTLRTLPVGQTLEEAFRDVSLLAEGSGYRIWQGADPRR